jgi:hypothetical protein
MCNGGSKREMKKKYRKEKDPVEERKRKEDT